MKTKESNQKPFSCTIYSNYFSDRGTHLNFFNWIIRIKDGTYKEDVEEIRRLTAAGETEKADKIKSSLPSICPCGYLPNGRKKNSPIELSLIMWLDYDIHNREWSEPARDKLKGKKGILAACLSPREGLRVYVKMPESLTVGNFKLYNQVMCDEIDEFLGAKHDEQATTMMHLTNASYDPNAWYVSPGDVTDFPVEELLAKNEQKVMEELAKKEEQGTAAEDDKEDTLEDELNEIYEKLSRHEENTYSKAQIDHMLTQFMGYNPLEPGLRNKNLLKLGQRAFYKRLSREELDYLIEATHRLIGCEEYTQKRIRACLCWGYTHCNKQEDCKTIAKSRFPQGYDANNPSLSHLSRLSHTGDIFEHEPIKLADSLGNYNEVVSKDCPYYPMQVYKNLPPFFTQLLCYGNKKRDTDALLTSIFTVMSGLMPNVRVRVRDTDYSSNLFFLDIAPAASGKSIVLKPHALIKNLKIKFAVKNANKKKEHEQKFSEWERYKKSCIRNNKPINWDLKVPEKFIPQLLEEAPQASRSKLITDLAQNPKGLITLTSELDIYSESLHCDYGDHSGELRAIPSNEPISQSYKNSEEIVEQAFPCLSLVASGTPPQFCTFVGNTHDGMASRCLIMLGEGSKEWMAWEDADEDANDEKKIIYQEAAKKCTEIYEWLEQYPTHVTIPKALRAKCDVYFRFFNDRIIEERRDNLKCMVNRAPIHVARICSILASMRKVEEKCTDVEIEANEQDVEVALSMVKTLLKHACMATTMLIEDGRQFGAIKNIFKQEDIFEELSESFTTKEIVTLFSETAGFQRSTINRIIDRWIEGNYIARVKRGLYAKTGKIMSCSNPDIA